jgi:hypothetical protein
MGSATDNIYAHSLPGEPPDKWETLDTHATAVANLAREFAAAFQAPDWGQLLAFCIAGHHPVPSEPLLLKVWIDFASRE